MEALTERQLAKAESAIDNLADALGITEQEVVKILKEGMESTSPIAGQLSKTNKYFIEEVKATYNVY